MSAYEKDQLVWAKVKGYAWWPAIVAKSNIGKNGEIEKEIQVNFIGETTHAAVSQDKIANFQDKFKEYSKTKTKKLQEAIKLAQGIQGDEPVIETHAEEKSDKRSASKGRRGASKQQQEEVEEAPQKKTRGRPKKNEEVTKISESAPQARKSKSRTNKKEETKEEVSIEPKARRGRGKKHEKKDMEIEESSRSKSKRGAETSARKSRSKTANKDEMEVEDKPEIVSSTPANRRGRKAATNKKENSVAPPTTSRSKSKKQEEQPIAPRVGRSNRKKTDEMITEPVVSKGRRSTSSKQSVSASPKRDSLPPRPTSTEILTQKPAELQFKAPAIKPRQPQSEQPQERNLLRCINAEPNMSTPIQVTVRKSSGKKTVSSAIAAKIGEKRSSSFWLKDLAAPNYLTNLKAKEQRKPASEIIVKKVKMSPCLQQKMTSVKGTSLKEIQKPRNNIMKAMLAYNSLMIRKFESDLEQILIRLSARVKDREVMPENDFDSVRLTNIVAEFEKSQFNGSEFVSSEIGKLFKTILRLMSSNKNLLNSSGNILMAGLTRVVHQIKEKIIRFCLDNSNYTDNFDISGDSEFLMEMENVDSSQISRSGARLLSEEKLRSDTRKEEASISSRGNSAFKGEEASEFGSESKQPLNLIMRNQSFKKFGKLFQDAYFIDKTSSQDSALQLEDLLSRCYHHFFTDYKQAVSVIEQFIEKEKFTAEEVLKFKDMDLGSFRALLRAKRREVGDFSLMEEGFLKKEVDERGRRRGRDDSLDRGFGLEEKRRTSVSKGLESVL